MRSWLIIVAVLVLLMMTSQDVFSSEVVDSGCYHDDQSEGIATGANDVVVVQQNDGSFESTPLHVRIGKFETFKTLFFSREGKTAKVYVNNVRALLDRQNDRLYVSESGAVLIERSNSRISSCKFSSEELGRMELKPGRNQGLLVVPDLGVDVQFNIHLLSQHHKLVLTDIDGTITTSDVTGFVLPQLGIDSHHRNVVEFLDRVARNGHVVVYLSARPMSFSQTTRKYLFQSLQNTDEDGEYSLPKGPLLVSPRATLQAVLEDQPNIDKTKTIVGLSKMFQSKRDVILGCFGNKNTDVLAYMDAGVRPKLIYLINDRGILRNADTGQQTTYKRLTEQIDALYPRVTL